MTSDRLFFRIRQLYKDEMPRVREREREREQALGVPARSAEKNLAVGHRRDVLRTAVPANSPGSKWVTTWIGKDYLKPTPWEKEQILKFYKRKK